MIGGRGIRSVRIVEVDAATNVEGAVFFDIDLWFIEKLVVEFAVDLVGQ